MQFWFRICVTVVFRIFCIIISLRVTWKARRALFGDVNVPSCSSDSLQVESHAVKVSVDDFGTSAFFLSG